MTAFKHRLRFVAVYAMLAAWTLCAGPSVWGGAVGMGGIEDSTGGDEVGRDKPRAAGSQHDGDSSEDSKSDEDPPTKDSKDSGPEKKEESEKKGDAEKKDVEKKDEEKKDDEKKDDAEPKKPAPVPKPETEGFDIIPAPPFDIPDASPVADVWRSLRSANLQLRFAVAEQGDPAAFSRARLWLDDASVKLKVLQVDGTGDSQMLKATESALDRLRCETVSREEATAQTLFGRFPLIRAFGIDPIEDEDLEIRSYLTPGMAERRAVTSTLTKIAKSASSDPLSVLIFVPGRPSSRGSLRLAELVDSESPQAFDRLPGTRLYRASLWPESGPMPAWDTPDPAMDAVCRRFLKYVRPEKDPRPLMLVMVREFADAAHGDYWIQAQQRTYELSSLEKAEDNPKKLEVDKMRIVETLAHDRSRYNPWILSGSAVLLLLALAIQGTLSFRSSQGGNWVNWLGIPVFGFLTGLILTPLLMLALKRGLPDPRSSVLVGGWWPCVAGALSLILPAGVFRLGAGSAARYIAAVSCHGRWGAAFVPVALGICAAWIRPALYALGELESGLFVAALGTAAALLVYCFGRAIDQADHFPMAILPITLSLALVFGGGAFLGSAWILVFVAGAAGLTTILHSVSSRRRAAASRNGDDPFARGAQGRHRPRTIAELKAALLAPLYQPPPEFERLKRTIENAGITQSTWIGLVGPSAAGKTAAAWHLIGELQAADSELQVLVGRCTEGGPPYQPFREALAEIGVSPGLLTARGQGGDVNSIIERLADEFIPFWDFFSGAADDKEDDESTRADLLAAVTNGLERLAENRRVVLFIDDIQWLDEGSTNVLKHLREHLAPGSEMPLVVVVAARDPEAVKRFDLEDTVVSLTPPTAREQVGILERSLGIENASARRIVNALGVIGQEAGGICWLIRAVQELANENAFMPTRRGFVLSARYAQPGRMPVPAGMREKLAKTLESSGEYQPIVECAALLGESFRIDDLAESLHMDRLKLLQALKHLEVELQLVRDVPADEERYAFSSTFMLEIVRGELGIGSAGSPGNSAPSKIAREWHARIAAVLAARSPRTPELVYRIAQHYYDAGKAYAALSVEHCLSAARLARRQRALGLARKFIEMAAQSGRLCHRKVDVCRELKAIAAVETQIAGKKQAGPVPKQDAPTPEALVGE